jgi:hypothetical protein
MNGNWLCCRFVLYVNNEQRTTDVVANDGKWHHIVFTWSSVRGAWKIYIDGLAFDTGYRLASGQTIKGTEVHREVLNYYVCVYNIST